MHYCNVQACTGGGGVAREPLSGRVRPSVHQAGPIMYICVTPAPPPTPQRTAHTEGTPKTSSKNQEIGDWRGGAYVLRGKTTKGRQHQQQQKKKNTIKTQKTDTKTCCLVWILMAPPGQRPDGSQPMGCCFVLRRRVVSAPAPQAVITYTYAVSDLSSPRDASVSRPRLKKRRKTRTLFARTYCLHRQ